MHRIEDLLEKARDFYNNGDPAHDFSHVQRVMGNCRRIGAVVGADLGLLLPAALLHDLVNLPKNHPERALASRHAAEKARQILQEGGFSSEEIARIQSIIVEHSFSAGLAAGSLESAVLQDADRLDALGSIGLLRTVACGTRMGARFYDVDDPFATARPLDDRSNILDHFWTKLFDLPAKMNTEPARAEAGRRVERMRVFVDQLRSELGFGVDDFSST